MNEVKLGQLIDENAQRDAIHVALLPAIAHENLNPGTHVGILESSPPKFVVGKVLNSKYKIGIVDPFLKTTVMKGERFFVLLYPNTVTSLRHEWTHDKIPSSLPVNQQAYDKTSEQYRAEQWIRDFIDQYGISYENMMRCADSWLDGDGDYLIGGEELEGESVPATFWKMYEIVTGKKPKEHRSFFSCSC